MCGKSKSNFWLQIRDENLRRSGTDVDAVDEVDVVASGAEAAQEGYGSLIVGGAAILVGTWIETRGHKAWHDAGEREA